MNITFNKAKPFPKLLISLFLLAVVGSLIYFICVKQSADWLSDKYETFGKFICKYDKILIGIILGANLIELIDYFVNSKRDEAINANYEYLMGHFGYSTFFKQYFAPIFTKGPYCFATEDRGVGSSRKIINFLTGTIKFIFWVIFVLIIATMKSKPELKEIILNGNRDYIFTAFVLFACINCNIFIYAFYKITPLYSSRSYEVTTYYYGGKTTTETKSESNFVAMLLLAAFIYAWFSILYFSCMSNKIKRMIETNRFNKFLNKCDDNQSILDFYREK